MGSTAALDGTFAAGSAVITLQVVMQSVLQANLEKLPQIDAQCAQEGVEGQVK